MKKIKGLDLLFNHWKEVSTTEDVEAFLGQTIKELKYLQNYHKGFYFIHDYRTLTGAYASQNIYEIFGRPAEFYIGQSFEKGMHYIIPEDLLEVMIFQKKAFEFIQKVPLEYRMTIEIDYVVRTKNEISGIQRYLMNKITPLLLDKNGNFILDLEYMSYLPDTYQDGFWSALSYKDKNGKIYCETYNEVYQSDRAQVSESERFVMELLIKGLSSQEIADKLSLSVHTINTHRKNLRAKFNCKSTAELIMKYQNKLR
jgi:DNA-binding CsgD family transcriptional regulator